MKTGTRAGIEGHGLTAREQAIMDLHEAEVAFDDIAARLGLKASYVKEVAKMYSGSWGLNIAFDDMVRRGSAALLAAIRASGGCFS